MAPFTVVVPDADNSAEAFPFAVKLVFAVFVISNPETDTFCVAFKSIFDVAVASNILCRYQFYIFRAINFNST